jgi:hypothetical protein
VEILRQESDRGSRISVRANTGPRGLLPMESIQHPPKGTPIAHPFHPLQSAGPSASQQSSTRIEVTMSKRAMSSPTLPSGSNKSPL